MYPVELHLRDVMNDLGKKVVSGPIKCQATFESPEAWILRYRVTLIALRTISRTCSPIIEQTSKASEFTFGLEEILALEPKPVKTGQI